MKLFEFDIHIGDWRVLVQSRDIQNGAIQGRHIADGAVQERHIADKAVRNRNIADDAVTGDKMAPGAIDGSKIKQHAVSSEHIKPGAVDITKIKPGTLDGQSVVLNSNFLAIKMRDNGTLVAYYGNQGQVTGVRSDERGRCYLQFRAEVVRT